MIKKHTSLIILTTSLLSLICLVYSKPFFSPNSYLFTDNGDGMKNYYTYAYYIKNNSFSTEFEGMNYPYYENLMFTDCHPFQSFITKSITKLFPGLSNYSIGILNTTLLLSFLISAIVIFYILRRLKINEILSILGAISIVSLSPQIFRLTGHLSLSYSFAIPLVILLIFRFEQDKKPLLNAFFIFIVGTLLLFTHVYLGVMICGIAILFSFLKICRNWLIHKTFLRKHYWLLFFSGVLPIICFFVFTSVTDSHSGRTTSPRGIEEYHADWNTVFLPVFKANDKLPGLIFPEMTQTWEGWSYIGFPTVLVICILLFSSIWKSIKLKKIQFNRVLLSNEILLLLFIISILFLLLSMFIPFRWNLQFLVEHLQFMKQLRALGRFSWVFYFTSLIVLFHIANYFVVLYQSKGKPILAYSIAFLVPIILIYESKDYHSFIRSEITQSPNSFDLNQNDTEFQNAIANINSNKYQAILPLPYYHIGSDNFGKSGNNSEIEGLSFLFSYHLSLPLISNCLARTSIWESKNLMQIFSSNFYYKPVKKSFPNSKPILVICKMEFLSEKEKDIANLGKVIHQTDDYLILELKFEDLFFNNSQQKIAEYEALSPDLFPKDNFLVSDTNSLFYFEDYQNYQNEISRTGTHGSRDLKQKEYSILLSTDSMSLELGSTYVINFWIYHGGENYGQDQLHGITFIQEKLEGKVEWLTVQGFQELIEIDKNWSLATLEFTHNNILSNYDLVTKGPDNSKDIFIVDDVLLRKKGTHIFKEIEDKTVLFWNNDRIPMNSNK